MNKTQKQIVGIYLFLLLMSVVVWFAAASGVVGKSAELQMTVIASDTFKTLIGAVIGVLSTIAGVRNE